MKLTQLQRRVARAEQRVAGHIEQTHNHLLAAGTAWRRSWTPWRIVGAGVIAGFLLGKSRPARALADGRWMQVASSVATVFSSLQSALAAWQAGLAADAAAEADGDTDNTVEAADQAPEAGPAAEPQPPMSQWRSTQPRAAEAATDVSEH
ncbi:MAG: protein sip-5 [Pseudoxanthomonas sp.]